MEYIVCAIYIDLENNIPANFNIKRLLEEIVLRNQSNKNNETVFAIKMACGNKQSIEKLESKLSDYNFDIRNVTKITANYKNRSDLIISLEAFETLFINNPSIEKYIFVSSDSDFTVIMEKLRKFGKQVWLVTSSEASQKPIFNNTCNEILTFDEFLDEQVVDSTDNFDTRAIEAFKRVLETLEHNKLYFNASIGAKFHQMDKSLELKNTRFKNIGGLVEYFKNEGLLKTSTSDKGHKQMEIV